MIHKINPSLDMKLVVETFERSTKRTNQVPKVVKPTNNKMLLYNFGDSNLIICFSDVWYGWCSTCRENFHSEYKKVAA